jgi:predicted transcriptional regulator
MTTKEIALKTIQDLPDSASWADIEERIRFLAAIDKGMEEIKAGKVIPHEEVKESLEKWLTS